MEWGMLLWIRFQRWRRERRITGSFDPILSAELDALIVAEEGQRACRQRRRENGLFRN